MAPRAKYPIRAKLLALTAGLVLASTAAYLALALQLFRRDKLELVYELNANSVKSLASELDADFERFADKAKLLTQGHENADWARTIFESDPDLIAFSLYTAASGTADWKKTSSFVKAGYFPLYEQPETKAETLHERVPIPFAKVLAKGKLVMNSSEENSAPVLTLMLAIAVQGDSVPLVAVADMKPDRFLKLMSDSGAASVYAVDDEGRALLSTTPAIMSARKILGDIPIVRDAVDSQLAFQLKPFDWGGMRYLGAYSTVGVTGARVISQVPEDEAFRAARILLVKSALFAALVFTIALLLSSWLARGMTAPISALVDASERLSRWDFTQPVQVKSSDELAFLARSFNAMAADLERQKKEIDQHQVELERKVKERTAALAEEKRRATEAQDALIRTTRLASLGELAGSAAHEILNPLNNISIRLERFKSQAGASGNGDANLLSEIVEGWAKSYQSGGWQGLQAELEKKAMNGQPLIEEDLANLRGLAGDQERKSAEMRENVEFIGREIVRITRILNNMRALSRVGAEKKPLDVHIAIEETLLTLTELFQKRNINLLREFSGEARRNFTVLADKDELVQVFSNVLRNAMHAVGTVRSRSGEVKISTAVSPSRVEVRIIDNGTGIAPEHLARVFEPTFTTKSLDEGTGLGLSISRRLMRAFNGDIEVESSEPNKGTTFLIWFPRA